MVNKCTMASKINVSPKVFTSPFRSYTRFLTASNLLVHNSVSQICYCCQISLQSAKVNCSFYCNLTPLGVTFILLAMVLTSFPLNRMDRDSLYCKDRSKLRRSIFFKFTLRIQFYWNYFLSKENYYREHF